MKLMNISFLGRDLWTDSLSVTDLSLKTNLTQFSAKIHEVTQSNCFYSENACETI